MAKPSPHKKKTTCEKNIQMVVTDLDGTLLNNNHEISKIDYKTLELLGQNNIIRVVATGRSVFSFYRTIHKKFPIDYLIFSSGAGILKWKTKEMIYNQNIESEDLTHVLETFKDKGVDFMVHHPVPDNHKFFYLSSGNKVNPDFHRRIELYKDHALPLKYRFPYSMACQIIGIIPKDLTLFRELQSTIKDKKVIRTTSPLDGDSIWIEIFHHSVSKGAAAQWLCNKLKIERENTLAVGNDYNDLDLLKWAKHSFVVENSPEELKESFHITSSNENFGFTNAVLNKIQLEKYE